MRDSCKDCPDRCLGCHNPETCSFWAKHEAAKPDIYKRRLRDSVILSIEKNRPKGNYKPIVRKDN